MDVFEQCTRGEIERTIRQVILKELADADRLSGSIVAEAAYKRFDPKNIASPQMRSIRVSLLKETAAKVLKQLFEPDQGDAETALRHRDALMRYAESRGLLKKGTRALEKNR